MADKTDWVVEGFQFETEQDAALARSEQGRIQRLEEKMDYNNFEMINAVYKKAVDNHVFKTPLGYEFLRKLQNILMQDSDGREKPADIPVKAAHSPVVEKIRADLRNPVKKPEKKTMALRTSMIINATLLIMVILMFWITMTGSNPNIVNYKRALQNKYSQWEKELSEREEAVREKERELLQE